jgi:uncharacterized membrane protein YkoI
MKKPESIEPLFTRLGLYRWTLIAGVLLALISGGSGRLHADNESDHHRAYRLRHQAAIMPLVQILERLQLPRDCRILEVEQEQEAGRYLYEIEYLTVDGLVHEITVDAVTGKTLTTEDH